jgi:competence protein ComEC
MEAYVAVALENSSSQGDRTAVTVAVQQVYTKGDWHKVVGKVRLHIKGTTTEDAIQYGTIYLILGSPQPVGAPLNPHAFNYQALLKQEKIYYQQHISSIAFHPIGYHPPSQLQVLLNRIRQFFQAALTKHVQNPNAKGIVLALVLGDKGQLNELLREAYAGAGTMHVLAVSGLHVGILYGLLSLLVYGRKGALTSKWVRPFLICLGLWTYAGVTGLDPSVLRATWMLSLVTLAKLLNRKGNIYNVLATSAFLLLLWNPLLLQSVSFQLSYLAVWGIVYLQPKIYHWFKFKNSILRHLWGWTSVSLAAQIATTPISLYYFHQFPVYFIIANWVVVPAAFLIFFLGIAVLFTSNWEILHIGLSWLLEQLIMLINQFVIQVNQLPYSVVRDIYMDKWQVGLWYGVLGSIWLFYHAKTFLSWVIMSTVICFLAINNIKTALHQRSQQGVIFYSVYKHEAMAFVQGTHSLLLVDEGLRKDMKKLNYHIKPNQVARGIATCNSYTLDEVFQLAHLPWQAYHGIKIGYWGGKRFILIDQAGLRWPLCNAKIYTDFLIIAHNSIKTLQPLVSQFEWGTLVIGSSNSKRLITQLQLEAQQLRFPMHVLSKEGALEVEIRVDTSG